MSNPLIRAKRLRAEYQRMVELKDKSSLIVIEQIVNDPPDHYLIRFTCRGISQVSNNSPVYSDLHRVALALPANYPTSPPLMEWLTPIFHPNIRANGEEVCIGKWYPAKTLDQLILMLGEMIQYKNYASHDPLNIDASLWALNHKHLFPVDDRPLLRSPQNSIPSDHQIEISIIS